MQLTPYRLRSLCMAVIGVLALLTLEASSGGASDAGTAAGTLANSASPALQQNQQNQQNPQPRLLTDPVPDPKQRGVQWFQPTGHTLRGSFLDYWNKNGGLAQFGYPLTEEFTELLGTNGAPIMVQYFERSRFEHHPEYAGTPNEVLLGNLGRDLNPQAAPAQPLAAPAVYFPQTGHNLSGAFKTYWDAHGGLRLHGFPISEQLDERSPLDGRTYKVQYFERSRMELHPEYAGTPHHVLLGLLGSAVATQKGYFRGVYPRTGRASDYSWIAGRLAEHHGNACSGRRCGCATVLFGGPKDKAQLEGTWWRRYESINFIPANTYIIAFGRAAGPNEMSACPIPLGLTLEQGGTLIYITTSVHIPTTVQQN